MEKCCVPLSRRECTCHFVLSFCLSVCPSFVSPVSSRRHSPICFCDIERIAKHSASSFTSPLCARDSRARDDSHSLDLVQRMPAVRFLDKNRTWYGLSRVKPSKSLGLSNGINLLLPLVATAITLSCILLRLRPTFAASIGLEQASFLSRLSYPHFIDFVLCIDHWAGVGCIARTYCT